MRSVVVGLAPTNGADWARDVMIKNLTLITAATLLIIGCMLYPYLPGDYDALATTLSVMAQLFGMAGLLLVPLGVIWLAFELRDWKTRTGLPQWKNVRYWLGVASICAATLVAIVVALGTMVDAHHSLGLALVALWIYVAFRLFRRLKSLRDTMGRTFNPTALYLIVLPIVAATFEFTLLRRAAEASRNRAIDDSARLISDIERFRETHGHYPHSLQSLWDDYRPSVIGIKRFHYEPHGEYYNVYFEHLAGGLDLKEIAMYNPRDEQDFSSHNTDLLQLTPAEIARMRGHVSTHDAARSHWKYFLFD